MRYGPNTTQGHGHGSRRLTRLHCTWHSTRYDGVRTGTCSGAACGGKRAAACLRSPPAYGARSTRAAALVDRVDRGAVACGAVACGVPSRLVPLSLAMLSAAPVGMARREAVPSSMMPSGGGLPNEERRMRAASGLAVRSNVSGNRTESVRAGRTFETSRTFKPWCAMARPRHRSIQLPRALLRTAAQDHCHDYRQCARRGRATSASAASFTSCKHL